MEIEDYKSNSFKSRNETTKAVETIPEEKKVEKVVNGETKVKKTSTAKKFLDTFINDDIPDIKNYLIWSVLVPKAKYYMIDTLHSIVDGVFGKTTSTQKTPASYISYDRSYDQINNRNLAVNKSEPAHTCDDIIFNRIEDAKQVLSALDELISTYHAVSIADLYDLAGITAYFTDNKYGWKNLSSARIERTRDGYVLKLPRVIPLD